MTDPSTEPDDRTELHIPQALSDDLAHLYRPGVTVPASVDRAVLGRARQRLAWNRRTRMILRWSGVAAAAAAGIYLALIIADPWAQPQPISPQLASAPDVSDGEGELSPTGAAELVEPAVPPQPAPPTVAAAGPNDIDRNGRIDILDAFTLARQLEQKPQPSGDWDVNNDGVVNDEDVETVAMAAVSLEGGAM